MKPTLAAIPQFVRYLSAFPSAARAVDAAFRGPLSHVGARTLLLWQVRDGDVLAAVGAHGHTGEEIGRYAEVPIGVDGLSARAVTARAAIVADLASATITPLSRLDEHMLQGLISRTGARYAVNVPIVHAGTVVGVYGFSADASYASGTIAPVIVDAVASALATWITHPRSEVGRAAVSGPREWSLVFSPRQKQVLGLVDAGLSTPAIATSLGVSESSIKADLQQVMRSLRTSDRREAASRARRLGLV